MTKTFGICENFAAKAMQCTHELLDEALGCVKTERIRKEISELGEKLKAGTITMSEYDVQKAAAKKRSWCLLPHAYFPGGKRCNEDAVPSGLYGFDIDHMAVAPRDWYFTNVAGMEREAGIAYAEVSLSGNGLHIIGLCPEGLGVAQSQRWLAKMLNIRDYDAVCKDMARCFFIGREVLYRADDALFGSVRPPLISEAERAEFAGEDAMENTDTDRDKADSCPSVLTDSYKGVPYADIVSALVEELGGAPVEGDRNNFIFKLVGQLRGICDNNPALLLRITPRFGLGEEEVKNIVKSATKEPVKGLCKGMKNVLRTLGIASDGWWRVDDDLIYLYERDVMNKLCGGLRALLAPIPRDKRMNVLCAALPILATYAEGIKFYHATGEEGHMALMAAIVGNFGKGKSLLCMLACQLLLELLDEQDEKGWRANEAYYEEQQTRSANERIAHKPKPLIRNIASVATAPYILERLKHSQGHTLVCATDEVQDIVSNPADNAERSKILRKSFDWSEHAVGRVGTASITGKVRVRLNTTVMGTLNAMRTFFGSGNVENGLSSRFIISFLPHEVGQEWLTYKPYDAQARAAVRQLVETLNNDHRTLRTPRIDKAIRQWWESKNDLVVEHDDEVLGSLINRMAVIGHRCGVLFHAITGKEKETLTSVKFAVLMAEYTLQEQLRFFGSTLKNISEAQSTAKAPTPSTNKRVLEMLPTEFSLDDVITLKPDIKPDSARRMMKRLTADGKVEALPGKRYRKL